MSSHHNLATHPAFTTDWSKLTFHSATTRAQMSVLSPASSESFSPVHHKSPPPLPALILPPMETIRVRKRFLPRLSRRRRPSAAAASAAAEKTSAAAAAAAAARVAAVSDTRAALQTRDWRDLILLAQGEQSAIVVGVCVGSRGDSVLHRAAAAGRADVVRALLEAGADVRAVRRTGRGTPLHDAARAGCAECAQALIDYGADKDAVGAAGTTPLAAAAYGGHVAVVKCLIDAGVDVSSIAGGEVGRGTSVLQIAAMSGSTAVVGYLLGEVSAVKRESILSYRRPVDGLGALHLAAANGHVDIVHELLGYGADITARSIDGFTPLDYATVRGYAQVEQKIILRMGRNAPGGAAVAEMAQPSEAANWLLTSAASSEIEFRQREKRDQALSEEVSPIP